MSLCADSPRASQASQYVLRITAPTLKTSYLTLTEGTHVIGRAGDSQVFLDSAKVSRHHAELAPDPFGRWWVRDLGSRNGSRLNGNKISESIFQPGDILEVGGFQLTLWAPSPGPDDAGEQSTVCIATSDAAPRISRMREYVAPRIEAAHLSAVSAFGHQLNVTQNQLERLRQLCQLMIGPAFKAQAAMVLRIRRADADQAHVVCGPEVSSSWDQPVPPISKSVLRTICDVPEPLLATNVATAAGPIELSISSDVLAMTVIAAPLRSDENTVDLLYGILPPQYGHGDWLALAALAVEHYRQAESVWANVEKIRSYAAVARELELAQQIQLRLVPREIRIEGLEVGIGFLPCHWVGGDYADVVPMQDGRVLLAIADVCGKGLPAALVTSAVHTMVHANVRAGKSIREMAGALNEYLGEYLSPGSFVTMIGLALDTATGQFDCVNAGHPPGIVVDAAGNLRQFHFGVNTPLGIGEALRPEPGGVLAPGELLALFTDGLTEIMNEAEVMLGVDGLAEELRRAYQDSPGGPLSELVTRITEFVDGYGQGRIAADDRTFMLVRREMPCKT